MRTYSVPSQKVVRSYCLFLFVLLLLVPTHSVIDYCILLVYTVCTRTSRAIELSLSLTHTLSLRSGSIDQAARVIQLSAFPLMAQ